MRDGMLGRVGGQFDEFEPIFKVMEIGTNDTRGYDNFLK